MTASTVSSSIVTNAIYSPTGVTFNTTNESGTSAVFVYSGTIEVATTSLDEIGDVIQLFNVRGQDRILALWLFHDDLDSNVSPALAYDVGLYKNSNKAGTSSTVVDADAYASAITAGQAAGTAGVNYAFEARNIDKMGQTVASDGGESTQHDSVRHVALTITTAAATAAAGTISWYALVAR